MTAVSTFSAFFMMPLWVFLLGEVNVAGTHISDIPYFTITKYAVLLVVPLLIGVSIRKCLPKVANLMVRFMKPFALFLIVFILVCGIWSQFFMLKLITWRTCCCGARSSCHTDPRSSAGGPCLLPGPRLLLP